MPDAIDLTKLQKFVEAAISNKDHPIYKAGLRQSPILQHYAVNVSTFGAIKPEQWFKDYPKWTGQLAEAMAYCEDEQARESQEAAAKQSLTSDVSGLQAKITALEAAIADLTSKQTTVVVPAAVAEASVAARDAAGMDSGAETPMPTTDGTKGEGDGAGEAADGEVTCPHCGNKFKAAG